ncbi:C45 family autoproteolytic acyltransferase/hydrolase [Brevibacillus sp. AG]|uniref:C45 family autoproteolytic acyltransferase/hydolase n=1 Tax=Brevibacillus sp. AG TaxID=3020891 RepID=UPI000853EE78|nr:C45 family peptidase [Brevibacillus sp. AG]MDC0764014.1 C45 family autoproteolytic acyltransferase/hydrolase [Brevibacillus sp. AG]
MERFPVYRIRGTARERGQQMGQLTKEQIWINLEAYERTFRDGAGLHWKDATEYATQFIPWIERYDQEIMEEIRGISEGAERDLLDIVTLNVRSEIMTNLGDPFGKTDGCTSVAAVPPVTKNQETIIGQNWDWIHLMEKGLVVLEIEQQPRPNILMITEAGIVGKIGMNDKGMGVCLNFLRILERTVGVPIHIVLRGILNSGTLSQAIRQITRLPRGTSANYLLAHREGETVDVEATSRAHDVLYPMEGYIAHANHFVGSRIAVDDQAKMGEADTHLRMGRAMKLLAAAQGQIEADHIKAIFRDHMSFPEAICRHGDVESTGAEELVGRTLFSIVMNLTEGQFELSKGQPCNTPYHTYRFSSS